MGTDRQDHRGAGLEPGERDAKPQGAAGDHSRLLRDAVHEVGLADELGDEPCLRTLEEVFGGPDLDDTASEEDGDSVRDDHRLRLVVRDVEGRDREGLVKPTDLEAHFFSQVCIEVAQRLVEEQDLGLHDQRPGDGDPLRLTARQLSRVSRLVSLELDNLQHLFDTRLARRLRHARLEAKAIGDVLRHGHVGPEGVALEDHRHPPPLGRDHAGRRREASIADPDLAGLWPEEPRDQAERRRLAAARRPEERDQLAGLHPEVEPFERRKVAIPLRQPLDRHTRHGQSLSPSRR